MTRVVVRSSMPPQVLWRLRCAGALCTPARTLKTLDVREYRPLGVPIEFRFYQRYTNNPLHFAEVQFLTHYNTHQRYRVKRDFIDYLNWGKEQGQARLPHRHQRVAFDFDDVLHPTRIDADNSRAAVLLPRDALGEAGDGRTHSVHALRQLHHEQAWFGGADRSAPLASAFGHADDLTFSFDPNRRLFSDPEHWNKMFSKRRPGEGDIRVDVLDSNSLLGPLLTQTDTHDVAYFKAETRGPTHGRVPGLNAPFVGERDRRLLHAMSRPLNRTATLTGLRGRFCRLLFLNDPQRHHVLSATLARELAVEVDKATNGVYTKLTVLEAAQSGQTDCFCAGLDVDSLGFDMQRAAMLRRRAQALLSTVAAAHANSDSTRPPSSATTAIMGSNDTDDEARRRVKAAEAAAHALLRDADRHVDRADSMLRAHAALIWRVYTAARPLMTLVNGKCCNTGCGLALAARYCALKDSSEFVCGDGAAEVGLTPYGGVTAWLARRETAAKYPGVAEFVLLTGTSLFAGDVLRLGWSDLFTTLPDVAHHIKEWFDASEHMHNDAVAWQLGHLLETCFHMTPSRGAASAHSSVMERCAITPTRARWIEDAFADQPSVEAVVQTLSLMEALPTDSRADAVHNTCDVVQSTPFTLASVEHGVHTLARAQLRYTLAPWDVPALTASSPSSHGSDGSGDGDGDGDDEVMVRQAGELFTSYVLERHGNMDLVVHRDRAKLRRWHAMREREYVAYSELKSTAQPRHVYARLEGCEGRVVDFEFVFDFSDECRHAQRGAAATTAATATMTRTGATAEAMAGEVMCTTMLTRLKQRALRELQLQADRAVELGWYVPTLDTCPVRNDAELRLLLQHDPAIEDVRACCRYPPVYFLVKRCTVYMSEWAYAVKHQLLLQSPYALKATFALLQHVRRVVAPTHDEPRNNNSGSSGSSHATSTGTEETAATAGGLNEALALEYQYLVRAMRRADFYAVGQYTKRSSAWWDDVKAARMHNVHDNDNSDDHDHVATPAAARPLPSYDEDVFERDVQLEGHRFCLRPRWTPRTLAEVRDEEVAALTAPLSYRRDAAVPLDARVYCSKADRIAGMLDDAGGMEVVPGLGGDGVVVDKDSSSGDSTSSDSSDSRMDGSDVETTTTTVQQHGTAAAAPLQSDAYVPHDIDFYAMARHPLDDTATSWRSDGYTRGSREYCEQQYAAAVRAVYDEDGSGVRQYWPSTAAVNGTSATKNSNSNSNNNNSSSEGGSAAVVVGSDAEALLEQRLSSAVERASSGVEPWARELRRNALRNALPYKTEIATQQEKIYDDEYYRWFVQPGHHPNASGMLLGYKGSKNSSSTAASASDRDLDEFLQSMLASPAALRGDGTEGVAGDGVDVDGDVTGVVAAAATTATTGAAAAAVMAAAGDGSGEADMTLSSSAAAPGGGGDDDDDVMEPLLDDE